MAAMLRLSAFADEISADLEEQIRVCNDNGITHFELRGVAGKNVLDFDPGLRAEIKRKLADNGLGVVCIASPVGKTRIDEPWQAAFDQFKAALELAEYFSAPMIRIFSFYPPQGDGDMKPHREEIIRRLRAMVEHIGKRPITLVHENEARIYGESGNACHDLMTTIDSPQLRSAFDFANFVQAGEDPRDNWPLLKPSSSHIHIKDALRDGGRNVPAGDGDGHVETILRDAYASGYRGFLSLEPHLSVAGQFSGFTGPELFKDAVQALRRLCARAGIPLAS